MGPQSTDGFAAAVPAPPSVPAPPPVPAPEPWHPVTVGVPGPEFEAQAPGQYSYDFPDSECDGWSNAMLTMRFASVRGARHRYYRQPRQDAVRAAVHETTGGLVFAVADGVSSASSAELGAIEACRAAVERTLDLLSARQQPLDFVNVARHAAERLRQLAQWRLGGAQPPEESVVAGLYATTLVVGAVRPDGDGCTVELCRIGDSGAWLMEPATRRYQPLFPSKTGSDALLVTNEVAPLPRVPERLDGISTPLVPGRVLLVGTDGFGDPLGDGDGQVGALFAGQLAVPPPPLWFGHLLDFSRETFDDDRSLLAVWPRTPAAPR